MSTALELAAPHPEHDEITARLLATLPAGFLDEIGWDPGTEALTPPTDHPLLSRGTCQVPRCEGPVECKEMCGSCNSRFYISDLDLEVFKQIPRRAYRKGEEALCQVPDCPRIRRRSKTRLCTNHHHQYVRSFKHLTVAQFVHEPKVKPQRDLGPCQALACDRRRDSTSRYFCYAHGIRWRQHIKRTPGADRREWARWVPPIPSGNTVGMRGLPPRVVAEVFVGLRGRCERGVSTSASPLRGVLDQAREHRVASLFDMPAPTGRNAKKMWESALEAVECALTSPEQERHKDVWNLRVFGHPGYLRFTAVRQQWLRESAKRWMADDLPRRRGGGVSGVVHSLVMNIARLSDSLHFQREDHGEVPALLGRRDIENFLNHMAFLQDSGELGEATRLTACRQVAKILRDFHELGLAHPGEPAAGMPTTFVIRRKIDLPRPVVRYNPGRSLPSAIMGQLYTGLNRLEEYSSRHMRVAVEVIMDTGRRPNEVFQIGWDCVEVDDDGKAVLVYTEFKNNRSGQRLPITDTTTTLLREQQHLVRELFPDTPRERLKLFPARHRNRDGSRSLTEGGSAGVHRRWVDALPPLLLLDGTAFDKADVTLYAYRHSYAQRHADAGTPPDVLRDLLGHTDIKTTQGYYRVTEKRVRSAIDKVVEFQFDRHGNRVWPQANALLQHQHARMRVGTVAVPFGTCSEPSNVKADGQACPFRFRCLGCGHFRTDPSYLPELRGYLQTLLRNRERVRAASDLDDWAAAEASPSDEEISRLRALIRRTEQAVDDLTEQDRTVLEEATTALRKVRQVVHLGMPGTAPPETDPRLERNA